MSNTTKAYEKIGLTKEDVLGIQRWMFPMIAETDSVGDMIQKVALYFQSAETPNRKLHYALYLLGSEIGQASVKEQLGLVHELDPQNV